MRYVLSVLRNDIGQVLILENKGGLCSLPGGPLEETQSLLKVMARYLRDDVGLEVNSLRQIDEPYRLGRAGTDVVHGMSCYEAGGKLKRFPHGNFKSVSWVSVTTALNIATLTEPSKHFLKKSTWISG